MPTSVEIEDLITILKNKHFKNDWLSIPTESATALEKDEFIELSKFNIISASNEILKFYLIILLNGDYNFYCKNEEAVDKIELLSSLIDEVRTSIDDISSEKVKYELQTIFQSNVLVPFEYAKSKLKHFTRDLSIQYNFENKERLFRADKPDKNHDSDQSVFEYTIALNLLIQLNYIEHFKYTFDKESLINLLIIERNCRGLTIDTVIKNAICAKANFLLKKLLYRKAQNKQYSSSATLIYSFGDQSDEEISLENIFIERELDSWDMLIQTHYGLVDNFKQRQRDRRKEIAKIDINKYQLQDYHGLIKIYKDDIRSVEDSKKLCKEFSKRFKSFSTQADRYARTCTEGYLFNNLISIECEKNNVNEREFIRLFESIRNFQNTEGVKNYFPWYKLANRLIREMNSITADLVDPSKYKLFLKYFDIYKKLIKNIKESCEWSLTKKFTPIQLSLEECKSKYLFSIDGYPEQRLFFHTSFILPLDYKSVIEERNGFISDFKTYSTLATIYERLQHTVEEVQEVSDHVRKQERRSIEVIAIFSAVALFSVGSIQIFGNSSVQSDPNVYYKFILAYGHSLAIFVILIWVITRDNLKKVNNIHWSIVLVILISTIILLYDYIA